MSFARKRKRPPRATDPVDIQTDGRKLVRGFALPLPPLPFFAVRVDDILTTEGNNPLWVFYRMGHNHFTVGHASFAGVENRFGSISLSEMGISIRIRKQLII